MRHCVDDGFGTPASAEATVLLTDEPEFQPLKDFKISF